MAKQKQFQKKPSTIVAETQHSSESLQTRPFAANEQATQTNLQAKSDRTSNFGHSFGNLAVQAPTRSLIQAKLTIGQPGDKYEQEAERVTADVVQRINQPQAASPKQEEPVQGQEVPEEEELQMKSLVQRREAVDGGQASTDLESSINSARGGGQALDAGLQRSMGEAMGADFSGVRVHTDTQADQLNQSIQAKAFTTGQDVFFRQGTYKPGSRGGQELIAHELTHVVQQSGAAVMRSLMQMQTKEEKKELIQASDPLTVQCWPSGTTTHLKDRAAERGITETQIDAAVKSGKCYNDGYGGTAYWDSSTGVTVCAEANGTKTTCYVQVRPKGRWTPK